MFFYRYFETLLIVCVSVCAPLFACADACVFMYFCMPGKTHDQHDKNAAPFLSSYLLACSLFVFLHISSGIYSRTMFVISFLRSSIALLLHFGLFVRIVTAFCPKISYQLVITIAHLNHSYLLMKSWVNFEFSLLLLRSIWLNVYECVCFCVPSPWSVAGAGHKYFLWPITFSYGWFHLKVWAVL